MAATSLQASVHAPGAIATPTIDALEALQVGQTMRAMARDHRNKMPAGTRELFSRVGEQLRSAAMVAMNGGGQ